MYVGGKVLNYGSYGCVFLPNLKCDNQKLENGEIISKLMLKEDAEHEYREMKKFERIIKRIPNYSKFFLVEPFVICKPKTISRSDLKQCLNLSTHRLDELRILQMPYGGVDLNDIFTGISIERLYYIELKMRELIINAIIPMNKLGLYHSDIKSDNIVVHNDMKLIDWGISFTWKPHNTLPYLIKDRPVQFNIPFSSIIINSNFKDKIVNSEELLSYAHKRSSIGDGHMSFLLHLQQAMYPQSYSSMETISNMIYLFIKKTITSFTHNGLFDYNKFYDVFFFNIDIWGALMSFVPLFWDDVWISGHKRNNNLNKIQKAKFIIIKKYRTIIKKYCYNNPSKKMSIPMLIKDMNGYKKTRRTRYNEKRTRKNINR